MDLWQAIALGAIQGLTEFLPVSSTGHLELFQLIYGITAPLTLDILLHVGTLIAVIVVYWRRLIDMLIHPIRSDLKWLVLATIPTVIAALTVKDFIDQAFTGSFLGISFLLTSAVLLVAEALAHLRTDHHPEVTWIDSLVMGVMQAFAILPGLSRSGSTIAGGLSTGLNRSRAADFAFLMSVPAVLGSVVLDFKDIMDAAEAGGVSLGTQLGTLINQLGGAVTLAAGVVTSAVFGFLAIKFMLFLIRRISLRWFSLYTGLLGAIVLAWQILN